MAADANESSVRDGVRAGLPLVLAVFAVAVSFGVLARPVLGALPAVVMSIVVFAGAAQFASLSVLTAGGTAGAAIVAGLLMNARFLPMGFAAAPSLRGGPTCVRAATTIRGGLGRNRADRTFAARGA